MYRKFDMTENLFFCIVHFSMDLNTALVTININKFRVQKRILSSFFLEK
jgi:hypothetical protein